MNIIKIKYILYSIISLYLICLLYTLAFKDQDVIWDAKLCLKMADNARRHIPFNYYQHLDPKNLNTDKQEFVAWWSPGQYTLPMLIQQATGVKLNIAIKVLIALCLIISATGIFKLYRTLINGSTLNEKRITTALACLLFAISQPLFWENVFQYDGGGILLLAYCPWFIYMVVNIKKLNTGSLILLLIAAFAGFFLKATFTCVFMGALFYLFLSKAIDKDKPFAPQSLKKTFTQGAYLVLIFAIYFAVIKLAFLSHNRNIGNSGMGIRLQPRVIAFPLVAPLFKLFALNALDKTIYWLMGCIVVLPLYLLMLKSKAVGTNYKNVLIGFFAAGTAFFMLLYTLNVDVSYELRHYTFLTLLLVPALLLTLSRGLIGKCLVPAIVILCITGSAYKFISTFAGLSWYKPSVVNKSGLLYGYPLSLLKEINQLDGTKPGNPDIFYFKSTDPLPALQVRNSRVLLEDCFVNFGFDNAPRANKTLYYGRNKGELYVVYPDAVFRQDSLKFLTKFEQYHHFDKIYTADGFSIYRAKADSD